MNRFKSLAMVVLVWMLSPAAFALNPAEIYDRAAPSVWAVRALDAGEKTLATGSGVVVAAGKLVTSCRLLARTSRIELRRGNAIYDAKLELPDVERDLCQLDVPGLPAPAVASGSARGLRPGQRVYVVGYSRGIEQSIGEGLVSSLRDAQAGAPLIQTSVPAARGLYGAGAFDENGRLVGIVTSSATDAPTMALAVPAEWLAELPARAQAALASRPASGPPGNAASPGLPFIGATYRYQWADHLYSRGQQEFVVRVKAVEGWNVSESLSQGEAEATESTVGAREAGFIGRRLADGVALIEFAPYLPIDPLPDPGALQSTIRYADDPYGPWTIEVRQPEWEQAEAAAGTFRALRIEIDGNRSVNRNVTLSGGGGLSATVANRFEYTVWYSPETRRYVRARHQAWNANGQQMEDGQIDLVEYRAR